jgi:hypothetical protein
VPANAHTFEANIQRGYMYATLMRMLGHFVLGHKTYGETEAVYAQQARDANAKAVEISIRVGVVSEETALRAIYATLNLAQIEHPLPGNNPCLEIADLLRRYPNHPSDLTECASTEGTKHAAPMPPATK